MATPQNVVFDIGSSNTAGFGALLDEVPTEEMTRYIGAGSNHPPIPSTSAQRPYEVRIPGARVLTPRKPYATNFARSISTTTSNTTTQVFFTGVTVAFVDKMFVYVRANSLGQGQFKRITAIDADTPSAGIHRVTISGTFSPAPTPDGAINIITDAWIAASPWRTVSVTNAGDVVNLAAHGIPNGTAVVFQLNGGTLPPEIVPGTTYYTCNAAAGTFQLATTAANAMAGTFFPVSADSTGSPQVRFASTNTITRAGAVDFTSAVVGRDVVIVGAAAANDFARRITAFTTSTITVDGGAFTPLAIDTPVVVMTGVNSAETLADLANPNKVVLQDLTIYLDENAPVYLTGLDYHNYGEALPAPSPRVAYIAGPIVNSMLEIQWQMRSRLSGPLVLIHLGISTSMVSPFLNGSVFGPIPQGSVTGFLGWYHDILSVDFSPQSPNALYTALTNMVTATNALLALENKAPVYESCFINLADNDPADDDRFDLIGSNFVLLRDALRSFTGHPGMLFIMAGPSRYGGTDATRELIYQQLFQIEADDLDSGVLDTRVGFVFPEDYMPADGLHFSALGQIKKGKGYGATWDVTRKRSNAAARLREELPTLATIRTKVRRRYERTDAGNSAIPAQIDMFINDSLREIYNTLGDSAWFLRVAEEVALSPSFPGVIELPRAVRRFLKVERASCPGQSIVVKGLAYTDKGRTQVTLHDYGGGPFICHFIQNPKELVSDGDVALLPVEYVELVVMLTTKRLCENTGNMGLATYYAAETDRLWRLLKREAQRYDRMRQGQLEGLGTYDAWRGGGYPNWMEAL